MAESAAADAEAVVARAAPFDEGSTEGAAFDFEMASEEASLATQTANLVEYLAAVAATTATAGTAAAAAEAATTAIKAAQDAMDEAQRAENISRDARAEAAWRERVETLAHRAEVGGPIDDWELDRDASMAYWQN